MATTKKPAAKRQMNKTFEMFVYNDTSRRSAGYDDRILVFGKTPKGSDTFKVDMSSGNPVFITTHVVDAGSALYKFCPDIEKQLGTGPLPENKLIRWTVTAEVVGVDRDKQKAVLEAALAQLK